MAKDARAIINSVVDLPTLPQVVVNLMAILDDPKTSVRDINNVMGKDPALVAKLLKLVNSAFYGIPKKVSSIPQAIAILGFKTIKSLTISASVLGMFEDDGDGFSYKDFWTYSVGVATVNRFLVNSLSTDPMSGCAGAHPDTAFVTGLLHGIGKLILDQYASDEFQAIFTRASNDKISFHKAETGIIDTSYVELGFWLTKKWQLPEEVQLPIMYQDNIAETPTEFKGLTASLVLSRYLCLMKKFGASGDFDVPSTPRSVVSILSLSKEMLPSLSEGLAEEFAKAETFLTLIR